MKPVSPQTGAKEITVAEDQEEYISYPAALYLTEPDRLTVLSRWTFTDEERLRVAAGEDLFLGIITDGNPVQPVILQVGPGVFFLEGETTYICPKCHEDFNSLPACRVHTRNCAEHRAPSDTGLVGS